jgi:rod shape-determining protein MreC
LAPPRNRRPGYSRRAQYGFFLGYVGVVAGAVIAAALLLLSTFNPPAYAAVRGLFAEITTPIASAFSWARHGVTDAGSGVTNYFGVVNENARLRKQLADSQALIERARTLSLENRRLRILLQVRDRDAESVVVARLVASTASSTRRYATLNAGSRQGVRTGQPVRGPTGLVGQVIETSFNTARVLLLIDPESVVPVRRTRDGMPAIVSGRGDGMLDIRSASLASIPFREGDMFVTSGTGGIFAPNVPVAQVVHDARDVALGRPTANPDAVDFVLVQKTFLPEARATNAPDIGK